MPQDRLTRGQAIALIISLSVLLWVGLFATGVTVLFLVR